METEEDSEEEKKNVYTFQKKPVTLPQEHNGWKKETVFLLDFELYRIMGGGGGCFFFSCLLFCFSVDGYWLQKEVLLTFQNLRNVPFQ